LGHKSAELQQVLAQAESIAGGAGQSLSSAHVLLAVFTVPNLAELLLLDRRISEETILAQIERMEQEPIGTLQDLVNKAHHIARGCDHDQTNCLHLLASITKQPRSFAYQLLDRAGISIPTLRTTALRYATHGVPRRLLSMSRAMDEPMAGEAAAKGSPGESTEDLAYQSSDTLPHPAVQTGRHTGLQAAARSTTSVEQVVEDEDLVEETIAEHADRHNEDEPRWRRRQGDRRRYHRGRRATDRDEAEPSPRGDLPARDEPQIAEPSRQAPPSRAPESEPPFETDPEPRAEPSPYVLNRERFRWLTQLGRNVSHEAWYGRIDPVIGRAREVEEALDVLNKRRSNNPCLVGEPGVGKTAVAEGLAARLVDEDRARDGAPERVIIQIDVGGILAGTHLRGSLAERLRGLQDEVRRAEGRVVVFIDEIHTLIGAGGGDGAHDAANELKAALARGHFPCIGATTVKEYREHIESDPALERRFTPVHVEEPDEEATRTILAGVVPRYSEHHGVEYLPEALEAAVRMSRRYIHERHDPDKSLSVLDLAGAVARRAERRVTRRAVAEVVSRISRVPVEHLMVDDPQRLLEMETWLAERIIGQRHALTAIGETIRRNFAGFAGGRPIGSFLFLGPTGVGKTQAVKTLAEFLFGSTDALMRFDMSEYAERHALARLIGAPPGYVGHGEGGQLTESVRKRPYQVILFDEIEKSHREIWNVLLQILDEGRLTDGTGRTVDFSNTVVVLTSNLGADATRQAPERRIGFAPSDAVEAEADGAAVLEAARAAFPPELWNRIECRLAFHPLTLDQIRRVASLLVAERSGVLGRERDIAFEVTPAAIDVLIERGGFEPELGARPMRQTIAREIEARLAERILAGDVKAGDRVRVDGDSTGLVFETLDAGPV
jgi:ATP-dependent Clp protease ATP-binding subunit ClpC